MTTVRVTRREKKLSFSNFACWLINMIFFSYLKIIRQIDQKGRGCFVKEAFNHCRVPVSVWSGCEYDNCRVPLSVWGSWELNHCRVLASSWDGCSIAISRNNGWIKRQELNLLPWSWVLTGLGMALLGAFLSVFCVVPSKCRLQGSLWRLSRVPVLDLHIFSLLLRKHWFAFVPQIWRHFLCLFVLISLLEFLLNNHPDPRPAFAHCLTTRPLSTHIRPFFTCLSS